MRVKRVMLVSLALAGVVIAVWVGRMWSLATAMTYYDDSIDLIYSSQDVIEANNQFKRIKLGHPRVELSEEQVRAYLLDKLKSFSVLRNLIAGMQIELNDAEMHIVLNIKGEQAIERVKGSFPVFARMMDDSLTCSVTITGEDIILTEPLQLDDFMVGKHTLTTHTALDMMEDVFPELYDTLRLARGNVYYELGDKTKQLLGLEDVAAIELASNKMIIHGQRYYRYGLAFNGGAYMVESVKNDNGDWVFLGTTLYKTEGDKVEMIFSVDATDPILDIAASSDGRYLCSVTSEKIGFLSPENGYVEKKLPKRYDITMLESNAFGSHWVVVGSWNQSTDTDVLLYDRHGALVWQKQIPLSKMQGEGMQNSFACTVTDSGKVLIAASQTLKTSGGIILYDVNGHVLFKAMGQEVLATNATVPIRLLYSETSKKITMAVGSSTGSVDVKVFNTLDRKIQHISLPEVKTWYVDLLADDSVILIQTPRKAEDGFSDFEHMEVTKIDLDSGDVIWTKSIKVGSLVVSPDRRLFAVSVPYEHKLQVYSLEGELVIEYDYEPNPHRFSDAPIPVGASLANDGGIWIRGSYYSPAK